MKQAAPQRIEICRNAFDFEVAPVHAEAPRGNGFGWVHLDQQIIRWQRFTGQGAQMRMTSLLGRMALVALLAVQFAGCANSMRVTSAKLCQGSGGT